MIPDWLTSGPVRKGLRMVVPAEGRAAFGEVMALADAAHDVGDEGPPPYLAPLIDAAANAAGVPAPLLAAVCAEISQYDPAYSAPERFGVAGLPASFRPAGAWVTASVSALRERDPEAIAALRRNVESAAAALARCRIAGGDWGRAVLAYVEAGAPTDPAHERGRLAGHILGTAAIYALRKAPRGSGAKLAEVFA